jgi:hypothetical protein
LKKERRKQFKKTRRKQLAQETAFHRLAEAALGVKTNVQKQHRAQFLADNARVGFHDNLFQGVEFLQETDAPLNINDDDHIPVDHNQIPWDEDSYVELPWWDQPDLDEDDEVTALCKKVLLAGAKDSESKSIEIKADKIHSLIIKFALKVQQRVKEHGGEWRKHGQKEPHHRGQQEEGLKADSSHSLDSQSGEFFLNSKPNATPE